MSRRWMYLLVIPLLVAACEPIGEENRPVDYDFETDDENRYHWDGRADPFFEGWYYKVNDADGDLAFFFIYGVIFPADPELGEAFLHFGGPDGRTWYVPFPVDDFHARRSRCEVYLESVDNAASEEWISGALTVEGEELRWELDLTPGVSWDETMSWLTNLGGLDVNWHVPILTGRANGFVEIGGHRYELSEALAYSDHNWGPAFPEYWMWLQGADFPEYDTAISISGGLVSGLDASMEAFQVGYLRDGLLHAFRTQDMAEITGSYEDGEWMVDAVQGDERVTVRATVDPATVMELLIPTPTGMVPGAFESLAGTIAVTFWELEGESWTEVDTRTTTRAGVEIGGTWPTAP